MRSIRQAAGLAAQEQRVLAAAGRDQIEADAGVGVLGQAAVLRDGADRDDAGQRGGIGDRVERVLPAAPTTSAPLERAYFTAFAISGICLASKVSESNSTPGR